MNISQEIPWTIPNACTLIWERFDSGCLIFNPLSGTTHLLFDPVLDILLLLQKNSLTLTQVILGLDLGLEGEEAEQVREQIGRLLLDLARLGTIQPDLLHNMAQS